MEDGEDVRSALTPFLLAHAHPDSGHIFETVHWKGDMMAKRLCCKRRTTRVALKKGPASECDCCCRSQSGASSTSDEDEDRDYESTSMNGASVADKDALKAAKKQHKKEVKEANRERRKHKIPKHVKKRQMSKNKKK